MPAASDEREGKKGVQARQLFQQVGVRARSLRLQRRLTLDELAARSGVSRRMVALLEAGEANPSIGTLDKLAQALEVDFGALVVGEGAAPFEPVASGGLSPVWEDELGSSARLLVSRAASSRSELWQWELAPGARYDAEPDPAGSEEVIIVSSGRLLVEVAGETLELSEGGYLRLESDRPYGYSNPGPGRSRFIRAFAAG